MTMSMPAQEGKGYAGDSMAQDFFQSCSAELGRLKTRSSFISHWASSSGRHPDHSKITVQELRYLNTSESDIIKKVSELREALGHLSGCDKLYCTDDCLLRYLQARGGSVRKADKMLRETLVWREKYKPEEIRWKDVAKEGETGKMYRTNFHDKLGRTVLVMAPGRQNTSDHDSQIRHLVFCLENAILSLPPETTKIVWLVDFRNWTICTSPPLKTAVETLNILQSHYPERLGAAICYDPPKIFEAFWTVVKPFVDPLTREKINFIYPDEPRAQQQLEEAFDLDTLEKAFGGRSTWEFDPKEYSLQMDQDDLKADAFWKQAS